MAVHKIVMISNASSLGKDADTVCGWRDVPLSEVGLEEARVAGVAIREAGFTFDIGHTCHLSRAQDTLKTVLDEIGQPDLPVEKTWRLNERHYGAITGLRKADVVEKYGEEQMKIWKRSYDAPPPPMEEDHPCYQTIRHAPCYTDGPLDGEFPSSESLKMAIDRTLPYWHDVIVPQMRAGKKILIAAHGNSLRAFVKHLDNLSDEDIVQPPRTASAHLPNGIPFVYELDQDLKPVKSMQFLGDSETVRAAVEAVAAQGRVKETD